MTLYFAYGSNMLARRLRGRAPSARPLGAAVLRGYALRFHKRARDGSAKCDAVRCDAAVVHGVLFDIDEDDWATLDRAEGRGIGYERALVEVDTADGPLRAEVYLAQSDYVEESLHPYAWYRDIVAAGAREHGLPPEYVALIERQVAVDDPDPSRATRELAWLATKV